MKKGFTLIELSIVLVIVGLLIGGILVAKSMIDSAKINAQIKQIQQIDIAVSNYKSKYNYLPGDSPSVYYGPWGWATGNGDGIVDDNYTRDPNTYRFTRVFSSEMSIFWHELQLMEGVFSDVPAFDNSVGAIPGIALPQAAMSNKKGNDTMGISVWVHLDTTKKNFYFLCNFSSGYNGGGSAISPITAFALDNKIDDGLTGQTDTTTYQGNVIAIDPSHSADHPVGVYGVSGSTFFGADTTKYGTVSTPQGCLLIALGINGANY